MMCYAFLACGDPIAAFYGAHDAVVLGIRADELRLPAQKLVP